MSENDNILYLDLEKGRVTIELRPDLAPQHVTRLKELANNKYYDDLTWHRVIGGFMAQGGCPDGTGMGGSGQKIPAEFSEEPYVRGTCGMARSADPDSGDSQFFICFADAQFLNGDYTVWGKVTEGMDLIDGLEKGEPPTNPDKIVSMRTAANAGE